MQSTLEAEYGCLYIDGNIMFLTNASSLYFVYCSSGFFVTIWVVDVAIIRMLTWSTALP